MQARDPSPDKRGSAKRRSPSASFKGSASGAGGIGVIGSCTAVSSRAGSRFSGAAPTVTAMTNSNARHPATISRLRKGGFNARRTLDNAVSPSVVHPSHTRPRDGKFRCRSAFGHQPTPKPRQYGVFPVYGAFATAARREARRAGSSTCAGEGTWPNRSDRGPHRFGSGEGRSGYAFRRRGRGTSRLPDRRQPRRERRSRRGATHFQTASISPSAGADRGDRPNRMLPRGFTIGRKGYD